MAVVSMHGTLRDPRRFVAALVLAAVLPFALTPSFEFTYDDHWTIESNRWLVRPLGTTFCAILRGEGTQAGIPDASRPLMVLSNTLDRRLFGLVPAFHHAHSVLLHALATVLCAAVVWSLLRNRRAAFFAGAFFAVAPIHAEVVASINYREDLLATIGLFGFVLCVALPALEPHGLRRAWIASACLAFGLLGKESAAVALGVVPIVAIGQDRAWFARRERTWIGAATVLLLYGSWRVGLAMHGDGVARGVPRSLADAGLRSARALLVGAFDSAVPRLPIPIHASLPAANAGHVVLLAGALLTAVWLCRRPNTRPYGVGIALTFVLQLASIPILGVANEWADRYLYASVLGPALVFGSLVSTSQFKRRAGDGIALACVALLGVFTLASTRIFRSDRALFESAVARAPRSARAHTALAYVHRTEGDLDGSMRELDLALTLDPTYQRARLGQAMTLLIRGDGAEANAILDSIEARDQLTDGLASARRCAQLPSALARRCANGESE